MSAPADIRGTSARTGKAPRFAAGAALRGFVPPVRLHPARTGDWRKADAFLAIALLAAVVIGGNLRQMPHGLAGFLAMRLSLKNALLIGAFAWVWPKVISACGLYAPGRLRTGEGEWPRLMVAGVAAALLAMVFTVTGGGDGMTPLHAVLFGVAFVPAAGFFRKSERAVERKRNTARPRQVVLVGSGPRAAELYRQLASDPHQASDVIGFVDSAPQRALEGHGVTHLGGVRHLENVLMHRVVDDVLIALPVKSHYDEVRQTLTACARLGVRASYSADLFGGPSAVPSPVGDLAAIMSMSPTPSAELLVLKRALDIIGAVVLIVLLAPVMLGVAVAIKLTSRGPVLFAHDRYGHMKRLFRMYKFRTMVVGAERLQNELEGQNEASGPVFKIRDDPRVTVIGRFLRRSSLDELPQFWHVLTGEMSLVGPRPLPLRDVGRFSEPWLMRRFSMRPGVTCLWQIGGRSDLDFERWIELDLEYIGRWSLGLDFAILLRTIPAVLRGVGAR
jgi:exopolysaccharide biosynthesis polyprenyl glycosylphosphotransferase